MMVVEQLHDLIWPGFGFRERDGHGWSRSQESGVRSQESEMLAGHVVADQV
jgi:hypothetical protein